MVFPIFIVYRSKDGIDVMEESMPDVAAIVCLDLCDDKEVIEEDVHIGK